MLKRFYSLIVMLMIISGSVYAGGGMFSVGAGGLFPADDPGFLFYNNDNVFKDIERESRDQVVAQLMPKPIPKRNIRETLDLEAQVEKMLEKMRELSGVSKHVERKSGREIGEKGLRDGVIGEKEKIDKRFFSGEGQELYAGDTSGMFEECGKNKGKKKKKGKKKPKGSKKKNDKKKDKKKKKEHNVDPVVSGGQDDDRREQEIFKKMDSVLIVGSLDPERVGSLGVDDVAFREDDIDWMIAYFSLKDGSLKEKIHKGLKSLDDHKGKNIFAIKSMGSTKLDEAFRRFLSTVQKHCFDKQADLGQSYHPDMFVMSRKQARNILRLIKLYIKKKESKTGVVFEDGELSKIKNPFKRVKRKGIVVGKNIKDFIFDMLDPLILSFHRNRCVISENDDGCSAVGWKIYEADKKAKYIAVIHFDSYIIATKYALVIDSFDGLEARISAGEKSEESERQGSSIIALHVLVDLSKHDRIRKTKGQLKKAADMLRRYFEEKRKEELKKKLKVVLGGLSLDYLRLLYEAETE